MKRTLLTGLQPRKSGLALANDARLCTHAASKCKQCCHHGRQHYSWRGLETCRRALALPLLSGWLFCGASKGNCHPNGVRCNPGYKGMGLQQSARAVVLITPAMLTHSAYSSQGLPLWQPHTWHVCHGHTKSCSAPRRRLSTAQHCRKQVENALRRRACVRRRTGKHLSHAAFTSSPPMTLLS